MRVVLDMSAFYARDAFRQLAALPNPIVLPVVAFAERVRQLERDGRDTPLFLQRLAEFRIEVEPLGAEAATRYTRDLHEDDRWKRLARDALIAGHVGNDDVLWTMNPKDFLAVGLPASRIHAILPSAPNAEA